MNRATRRKVIAQHKHRLYVENDILMLRDEGKAGNLKLVELSPKWRRFSLVELYNEYLKQGDRTEEGEATQ